MPIDVQIHYWPWSKGIREETQNLMTGNVAFPFWGSPVVSVSERTSLYLPVRHEKYISLGPLFDINGEKFSLHETPHGVMTTVDSQGIKHGGEIHMHIGNQRFTIQLMPDGVIPRYMMSDETNPSTETDLARIVIAWSQFFDDLLEEATKTGNENRLSWAEAIKSISDVAKEEKEPRKALIVDISIRMHGRLHQIVSAARRILSRERRMLPAGRVTQIDTACMKWMIRQPGETMAEKAAVNNQKLLGIARRESFDTLENRVLKDFILRCAREGNRYLNTEVGNDSGLQQSRRATLVRNYKHVCTELCRVPFFENIASPPHSPRPNYVLQNDGRYRGIWNDYVRLLKRDDEEDCLWDWQSRTWADICRFLVCSALFVSNQEHDKIFIEERLTSSIQLVAEQRLGSRFLPGSEPGPFLVRTRQSTKDHAYVLEVVHSGHAGNHPATRLLGGIGGHLYLVFNPLSEMQRRFIIIVWAVHTASAQKHPSWQAIVQSAGRALEAHSRILDYQGDYGFPILRGFVIASELTNEDADLCPGEGNDPHLVRVPTDQRYWYNAMEYIKLTIEDILEKSL
jgi:hypothetical protein